MKIIFDSYPEDIEEHARFMHRKLMHDYRLPRLVGVTRALVPGWCDSCNKKAWGPVIGGYTLCRSCLADQQRRGNPGF